MKKEVTPGMIVAAIVVVLILVGGAYWLFGREPSGPNNLDQLTPGHPQRLHVGGMTGGNSGH